MDYNFLDRDFLEEGLDTKLNQGSVFIGAYAEDYTKSTNYGLIITARCDIAQKKAKKYSYLPIIPIKEWLKYEFLQLLHKRVINNARNNLKKSFISIGGSELLLKTYSLDKLIDRFQDAGNGKQRKTFTAACEQNRLLEEIETLPATQEQLESIIKVFKKDTSIILKNLMAQNETGYYFIDDIWGGGPHIVLLREIHHLDNYTASKLRTGVRIGNDNILYRGDEDLSYTIGIIRSPFIEHIMQNFSQLFIRIGIEDPDFNAVDNIIESITREK